MSCSLCYILLNFIINPEVIQIVIETDTITRTFRHFLPGQRILKLTKESAGNINGTYRIYTAAGTYILQEISRTVFGEHAAGLESNYRKFLDVYDRYGPETAGFAIPRWLPDTEGNMIYTDKQQRYWRIYPYLPGEPLSGLSVPNKTELFAGAVSSMHFLLSGLSGDLQEVIGHFHEIRYYADAFLSVTAVHKRDEECEQMIAKELPFLLENCVFEKNAVIHGDTKIGNILYDKETRQLSFIDLDTFCYASRLIDIGDSVRSAAYKRGSAGNDERGGGFDRTVCLDFLKAYISAPLCRLSREEISRLPFAVMRIPFELGLRYYTDYLMGNPYFPTACPERNLVRAKEQFGLYRCCKTDWNCGFFADMVE